jgi:hypothetical protein
LDIKEQNTQPKVQGKSKSKDDEKGTAQKFNQDRFPVIPKTLNSHHKDLIRLNNHQNLPKNHQTQQSSNKG